MHGPVEDPSFPTKIALIFKIIGSLLLVWSIVNWVIVHSPIQFSLAAAMDVDMYGSLLRSMGIIYLILGVMFIMNGIAISKIIEATKDEIKRAGK